MLSPRSQKVCKQNGILFDELLPLTMDEITEKYFKRQKLNNEKFVQVFYQFFDGKRRKLLHKLIQVNFIFII
jgi:hypothetical protein